MSPMRAFSWEASRMGMQRANRDQTSSVAIIGAGPYALSIASHLREHGIDFRVFGDPVGAWRRMPAGMHLKSAGLASNLHEPSGTFTLERFCRRNGLAYHDLTVPIPLDVFVRYAESFQQQLVPDVERVLVTSLDRSAEEPGGYVLLLDRGETVTARQVIVATGMTGFPYVPPALASLAPEAVSHSSDHHDLGRFAGRAVTVVGRGSSALDIAALLHHRVKAQVRMVARHAPVIGVPPVARRRLWSRVRRPLSDLGSGWRLLFYSEAPRLFRLLP